MKMFWLQRNGNSAGGNILKYSHWPQYYILIFLKNKNLNFEIPVGNFCEDQGTCRKSLDEKES